MAEQNNEKHLEQLLDSLLSRYSDAQPRPGLETRVLATVRAQSEEQKSGSWMRAWMWAGAAIAVFIVAALVMMNHREKTVPPSPSIAHAPEPSAIAPEKMPAGHQRVAEVSPRRKQSPLHQPQPVAVSEVRQEVFPTPTPPSEQERLLLGYLARTPRQEIIAQSRPDMPAAEETPEEQLVPETQPVVQRSNSTR